VTAAAGGPGGESPPAASGSDYGVIVLNYQNWPSVADTINSVLAQDVPPGVVVVVDNASTTGDAASIRAAFPDVHVVESETNGGYAAGMNLGLRHLPQDLPYALLLTHDVLLDPGAVRGLSDALDLDTSLAVAGPLLCFRSRPDKVFSSGGQLIGCRLMTRHDDAEQPVEGITTDTRHVEWVDGSCMLVRRVALRTAGLGFDEGYFLYLEETELQTRLWRAGWGVGCVRGARAWQEPGNPRLALWTRNRLRFVWRNAGLAPFLAEARETAKAAWRQVRRGDRQRAVAEIVGLGGFVIGIAPERIARFGVARHEQQSEVDLGSFPPGGRR